MPRGVLYVESRPANDQSSGEYHRWYDEVHLPEVMTLAGIVGARRFAPVSDDGPFVAIYEIDADDLDATLVDIMAAGSDGRFALSPALETKPFPKMRLLRTIFDTL